MCVYSHTSKRHSILLLRTIIVVAWCVAAVGLSVATWQERDCQQVPQTPHAHYLQALHTNT